MPQEGLGVALGAQVGHLVTYRDPLRGALGSYTDTPLNLGLF